MAAAVQVEGGFAGFNSLADLAVPEPSNAAIISAGWAAVQLGAAWVLYANGWKKVGMGVGLLGAWSGISAALLAANSKGAF